MATQKKTAKKKQPTKSRLVELKEDIVFMKDLLTEDLTAEDRSAHEETLKWLEAEIKKRPEAEKIRNNKKSGKGKKRPIWLVLREIETIKDFLTDTNFGLEAKERSGFEKILSSLREELIISHDIPNIHMPEGVGLSPQKIKFALESRVENAIENYLESVAKTLKRKKDKDYESNAIIELERVLKSYLNIYIPYYAETWVIAAAIIETDQYCYWYGNFKDAEIEIQVECLLGEAKSLKEAIYDADLNDILEQLASNFNR